MIDKSKIIQFEKALDQEFENLEIMDYNRFQSIEAVGVAYEIAMHNYKPVWGGAIDILIPKLLNNFEGEKINVPEKIVFSALNFAQKYYHLRDYFYFVYNVPKSMKWHFSENKVSIKLVDDSIQLERFMEINSWFMQSHEVFSEYDSSKER